MPGIKASPGMTDLEVCHGAFSKGSEGVQSALQKARWKYDHVPLQRAGDLNPNRYSGPVSPLDPIRDETILDDAPPSPPSLHEGYENVADLPSPVVSPQQEEFGLPPTPPTHLAGDDVVEDGEEGMSPPPLFVDGVRNALRTEKSTTPVKPQASPPTPDPSPPRKIEHSPSPQTRDQKATRSLLNPLDGVAMGQSPISYADSFQTAQEQQSLASISSMSPVHLPDSDKLPQHWLDTTRELQVAGLGLGDFTVKETPRIEDEESTPRRASPSDVTPIKEEKAAADASSQIEKPAPSAGRPAKELTGLGLSGLPPRHAPNPRAQDYNNQVYRRIQEENVKRHSTVSANSGAITVGIVLPALASTPQRTLKRQTKCHSLRGDSSTDSQRNSASSDKNAGTMLRSKKLRRPERSRGLDDSPVFESSIRQVSSPAKLGVDASDITALTLASLQDSPSARKMSKFQNQPTQKLRHFSHEDRLSNNLSVRRTSLEASPPLNSSHFPAAVVTPERKLPHVSAPPNKVTNNMAAKRSNMNGTRSVTQPLQVPKQRQLAEPQLEDPSSSGKLRHFSHEARLENNEQVRRTSLDRAPLSPQLQPARQETSFDSALSPSSPRKSMDARYLFPSTTPMSVSQVSDRTENIEIGEANGVRLFSHNNNSLLVVQHSSRPTSKGKGSPQAPQAPQTFLENGSVGVNAPQFAAQVEPPTPTLATSRPPHQVDSPLTNPRAAPEPPTFQFIPPTPERELLEDADEVPVHNGVPQAQSNPPRKRLSLVQRARRYSDIVFPNLGGLRRPVQRYPVGQRDRYLSPLWRPQGFWDEFDSEDEYDDFEASGTLPRGGDTSHIDDPNGNRRALFPRAMSKRLAGFRGTGGFLLGNSLGIDRHGTNNRRHYVSTTTRTINKRPSEELMKHLTIPRAQKSQESMRLMTARAFVIPFTGGSRAYWVGSKRFRAKMRARRLAKEEKAKQNRQAELRRSIGTRIYHDQ